MNSRGVLLVFYDLPVKTAKDRVKYREFRKGLVKNGFIQMQKSLYMKLIQTSGGCSAEIKKVKAFSPSNGTVQALPLKLEDFLAIKTVCGHGFNAAACTGEMVII